MIHEIIRAVLAAGLALAFAVITPLMTAQATAGNKVKNIVLVHGAFADGTSWSKVIPILEARGYHVTAVQNP